MTHKDYLDQFKGKVAGSEKDKVEMALEFALDIRKFEIELYWKRATYFWTFIGAALAGYALVYKASEPNPNTWLSLLFSSLGLLFSMAWYLVNRGSKFWQNNWERHVDLLEDEVIGPLYKTIAHGPAAWNPLTASAQYSVSKINQILSLFVLAFWAVLFLKSIELLPPDLAKDGLKTTMALITFSGFFSLLFWGKSANKSTITKLQSRQLELK
ncbi:hypothetical protein BUE93_08520 [Chromobacterium amazonense]|uniref:Uncharacterized protein n=1 Tax=Chromobacterium amazonense TaxID=1382803 RepID=A0A2S9X5I7_9NEIS|nr:hypothetical protein [Chromobacterium amazonense]PRP70992.1 hypothetical protein BUE93_08520 [Chromobacterium amazonense]